jgi:hypothetical protein
MIRVLAAIRAYAAAIDHHLATGSGAAGIQD